MINVDKTFFITFEGIDGCGKTTALSHIYDQFILENMPVVKTREPGGTPVAEKIRKIVKDTGPEKINENTELLLISASRSQHIQSFIKPNLNSGYTVLCDRYIDATIAYQNAGRGIDIKKVEQVIEFSTQGFLPNLTILIDIDYETSIKRKKSRGIISDRFDNLGFEFFERVRNKYLEIAKDNPERFIVINGMQDVQLVKQECLRAICRLYEKEELIESIWFL